MNTRATLLVLTMVLASCSASHDDRSALATPQPNALATPRPTAFATPIKIIIMDPAPPTATATPTPWSFVKGKPSAAPAGVVAPRSGASEAARAAEVESRSSIIPMVRDVPAGGVVTAPRAGGLPAGVPYASDKDPVQIISYVLSSTIIHPGDKVTGDVVTSSNAASVTAQVGAFSVAVPKVAPGKFHLLMQLPSMPLPPGAEKLIITAIRTDGMRTTREVPITVVL
jgi:hypothetical protein